MKTVVCPHCGKDCQQKIIKVKKGFAREFNCGDCGFHKIVDITPREREDWK